MTTNMNTDAYLENSSLSDDELKSIMMAKIANESDSVWLKLQIDEEIVDMGSVRRFYVEKFCTGKYGWNSDRYASYKRRQEEFDDYIFKPVEVIEGVLICLKCKSRKILSTSSQTRAADEPMTVFAKCTQCKNRWIISD